SLVSVVHLGVGVRGARQDCGQTAHHYPQDQKNGQHLDQRVTPLRAEAAAHSGNRPHLALASTSASAPRATASLRRPMPHWDSTRRSTVISTRSAAAPCDQPNFAPVTIQACWYSQCRWFAA